MHRGVRVATRVMLAVAVVALAIAARRQFGIGVVGSGSMWPALIPGDAVVFERGARPDVGDMLVYDKPGWPEGVVHRVVRRLEKGAVRTKGDANPIPDLDPVQRTAIRGKVVAVVPFGRVVALATGRR